MGSQSQTSRACFQVEQLRKHLASVAMKGAQSEFVDLLPPSARSHLEMVLGWDRISFLAGFGLVIVLVAQHSRHQQVFHNSDFGLAQ